VIGASFLYMESISDVATRQADASDDSDRRRVAVLTSSGVCQNFEEWWAGPAAVLTESVRFAA
jgi:hypothetical protein